MELARALAALEAAGAGRCAAALVGRSGVIEQAGPVEEVRSLASVTKVFTTLAVLVACEEGAVGLDDAAGPPGATLRHLLAHASGVGPDDPAQLLAAPGRRRIYSNAGIELAAAHLEQRSGIGFGVYLAEGVLDPVGTPTLVLEGSPAHAASGSVLDLVALARELLNPTVISAELLSEATQVAFPGLAGVVPGFGRFDPCDWGIGFELVDDKAPHWSGTQRSPASFGHFGMSGCFLLVDPERELALALSCTTLFGPWAAQAWPAFADAVLAEQ